MAQAGHPRRAARRVNRVGNVGSTEVKWRENKSSTVKWSPAEQNTEDQSIPMPCGRTFRRDLNAGGNA